MRILGIDPGSRKAGVGIIEAEGNRIRHIHHTTIHCVDPVFTQRLGILFAGLKQVITEFHPDMVAIEDVFMGKNASSALKLGQARGALIAACANASLPIASYSPTLVKQSLIGYGRAEKGQMQYMVGMLLALPGKIQEDAADALAVAICHANHAPIGARAPEQTRTQPRLDQAI
ncbi:MAG: crossover junction endodeoxyribonuclease RuvC [Mariprofundales bacterium]|nr:crossover junction endodeoxyribonuclease RuvC [Mariprofundales bacterium]